MVQIGFHSLEQKWPISDFTVWNTNGPNRISQSGTDLWSKIGESGTSLISVIHFLPPTGSDPVSLVCWSVVCCMGTNLKTKAEDQFAVLTSGDCSLLTADISRRKRRSNLGQHRAKFPHISSGFSPNVQQQLVCFAKYSAEKGAMETNSHLSDDLGGQQQWGLHCSRQNDCLVPGWRSESGHGGVSSFCRTQDKKNKNKQTEEYRGRSHMSQFERMLFCFCNLSILRLQWMKTTSKEAACSFLNRRQTIFSYRTDFTLRCPRLRESSQFSSSALSDFIIHKRVRLITVRKSMWSIGNSHTAIKCFFPVLDPYCLFLRLSFISRMETFALWSHELIFRSYSGSCGWAFHVFSGLIVWRPYFACGLLYLEQKRVCLALAWLSWNTLPGERIPKSFSPQQSLLMLLNFF